MPTILCIDDSAGVLELDRTLLELNGYSVLTALDGQRGIAIAREYRVDAVVLDFNMPGMDGNQVAAVLSKEQPNLPIVINSGSPDDVPESNGSRMRW